MSAGRVGAKYYPDLPTQTNCVLLGFKNQLQVSRKGMRYEEAALEVQMSLCVSVIKLKKKHSMFYVLSSKLPVNASQNCLKIYI